MIGISLLLRHCVLLVMATLLLDATTDRNTCTVNAFKTGLQQQPLPLPLPWSNNRSVRDTVPYFADLTSTVDVADVDEKSTKTLQNTTPLVAVSVTAVTMADADVDVDIVTMRVDEVVIVIVVLAAVVSTKTTTRVSSSFSSQ
mmetsp:Transcript_11328/g.12708  ORF Transcript_11328/g.12708 Transcript_11328/m.12708 type:complete len:143 (+) Transcript_11328:52-480(+)